MEKSAWGNAQASLSEFIGYGGELSELKHLSSSRNRNQFRDSLSSGERTGNSPNSSDVGSVQALSLGCCRIVFYKSVPL